MIKREANFGTLFRHWLRANPFMTSAAFELKQTRTDSISFNDVQEHQIDALVAARGAMGILYKAPDDSRGVKPFDFFYLREAKAFVVIKYPKCFCLVPVEKFILEKASSVRRSLTSARAREISTVVVEL